jgi:hypothetical protein
MINVTETLRKIARTNRRRGDDLVADILSETGGAKAEAKAREADAS